MFWDSGHPWSLDTVEKQTSLWQRVKLSEPQSSKQEQKRETKAGGPDSGKVVWIYRDFWDSPGFEKTPIAGKLWLSFLTYSTPTGASQVPGQV